MRPPEDMAVISDERSVHSGANGKCRSREEMLQVLRYL